MRTTIAATAVALALLAGCGGGDSDTALTPGDSATPTTEPSASATASATAKAGAGSSAKPRKTASSSSDDGPYFSPGTASGDSLPLAAPLLSAHENGAPYPASQLSPEFAGDVVVDCGATQFPVDRLLNPRPASDLSKAAKKWLNGYIDISANGIVAVADEHHVIVLERYPDNPESFDYAEAFYETREDGKERWWVDTDYPPSSCDTKRVLPGLDLLGWSLAVKPKPGDRSIQVSFYGNECNGKPAIDRVKVSILGMGPDGIRIALGEEPPKDGEKCAKAKPVTYTVALPEPIGDRQIFDVGAYPEANPDTDYPTA